MRNADIRAVITAIKKEYKIYSRDIAETIGISPAHFSTICNGRFPMTDVYRDLLLKSYPRCAEIINTLPVEKISREPFVAQKPSPDMQMQQLLTRIQQMVSTTNSLIKDNQKNTEEMLQLMRSVLEQNRMLIQADAEARTNQEAVNHSYEQIVMSVTRAMNAQAVLFDKLADRLGVGPANY
jgi:hypothetical protein